MVNASGILKLHKSTIELIREDNIEKGNVLESARVAAILAIKKASEVIPMNRMKQVTGIKIDFKVTEDAVDVSVDVKSSEDDTTEVEALYGLSVALITIWDMVQTLEDQDDGNYPLMTINRICKVEEECGGGEPLLSESSIKDVEGDVLAEDIHSKVDRESLKLMLEIEGLSHLVVEEPIEEPRPVDSLIDDIGDGASIEDIDNRVDRDSLNKLLEMEGLSHLIIKNGIDRPSDLENHFKDLIEEVAHKIHIRVCKMYVSVDDEVNIVLIYAAGILFRMTDEDIYSELYEVLFDRLEKLNMIIPLNIIVKRA